MVGILFRAAARKPASLASPGTRGSSPTGRSLPPWGLRYHWSFSYLPTHNPLLSKKRRYHAAVVTRSDTIILVGGIDTKVSHVIANLCQISLKWKSPRRLMEPGRRVKLWKVSCQLNIWWVVGSGGRVVAEFKLRNGGYGTCAIAIENRNDFVTIGGESDSNDKHNEVDRCRGSKRILSVTLSTPGMTLKATTLILCLTLSHRVRIMRVQHLYPLEENRWVSKSWPFFIWRLKRVSWSREVQAAMACYRAQSCTCRQRRNGHRGEIFHGEIHLQNNHHSCH